MNRLSNDRRIAVLTALVEGNSIRATCRMMRIRTRTYLAVAVLSLSACESDEKKLQRLQGDQLMYCLDAQAHQREYETARYPGGMTQLNIGTPATPKADSLRKIWYEYKTKCELATRDLNRFMH